jgi:hypothetical protein
MWALDVRDRILIRRKFRFMCCNNRENKQEVETRFDYYPPPRAPWLESCRLKFLLPITRPLPAPLLMSTVMPA